MSKAQPSGVVLAIDLGGTHLRTALARTWNDLDAPLDVRREPTQTGDPAAQIRRVVLEAAQRHGPLRHAVVGLPGVIHVGQVYDAPNLGALQGRDVLAALGASLPCPATFVNDCNLAALGESRGTAAEGDLAFIAIGTGLGAGLVRGGQIIPGAHGQAGEFGLLPLPDGLTQAGAVLEDLLSGPGIQRRFAALGGMGAALTSTDEAAQRLRGELQHALAYLLRVVTLGIDPQQIVFGGGVGLQLGALLEAAWQEVRNVVGHVPRPTLSRHGNHTALIGGLRLALLADGGSHGQG
ncbi:ROK family protein [Deinococcus rubellus]|uniref:ROK family protein n=1 Tax=Deinococcus rubellus TaxID=1889240 RepID=UPI0031EDA5F0